MYKKLSVVMAVIMIASMFLAACKSAPTEADCAKADVLCVGLVTDVGEIDDKSFNQSAWAAVQQARKKTWAPSSTMLRPKTPRTMPPICSSSSTKAMTSS